MNHKLRKALLILLVSIPGLFALFYFGGIVGQVLENYQEWVDAGGMTGQARMARASWDLGTCFSHTFTVKGLIGMGGLLAVIGGIFRDVRDTCGRDHRGNRTRTSAGQFHSHQAHHSFRRRHCPLYCLPGRIFRVQAQKK